MSVCPKCFSIQTVKNGRIHNGKQRFLCRECGRERAIYVEQLQYFLLSSLHSFPASFASVEKNTQYQQYDN